GRLVRRVLVVGRAGRVPGAVHVVGHDVRVVEVLAELVGLDVRDLVLAGRQGRGERLVLAAVGRAVGVQLGADIGRQLGEVGLVRGAVVVAYVAVGRP